MVDELRQAEANASDVSPVNYTGSGRSLPGNNKSKMKLGGKVGAGAFVGFGVAILAVGVALIGTPIFMIGALDYNLQDSLGFSGTVAILENQAEYVTAEMAKKGELPSNYANDLAKTGLDVGQVTAKGDFVRTNKYIAEIERLDELAVVGSGFEAHGGEGELAFLFDNEVVTADDFVAKVEANPRMYAAFSEGANISARFYYSQDVDKVYQDMGLTRYAFNEWEDTGNAEENEESFNEILTTLLDDETSVAGAECGGDGCGMESQFSGDAEEIVAGVSSTKAGAQLLNSALSANEPYKAASAFMAIEEPLQRTRIDGDGPANEVMNMLNQEVNVKYLDIESGEVVTKQSSILETANFAAAASDGTFDKNEARNFSRDRVLLATSVNDDSVISGTSLSSNGRKKSSIAVGLFSGGVDTSKATDTIRVAFTDKNSELFPSIVGGNRAVEGGAFLSNKINMRTLGAMPSDESTVMAYGQAVDIAMERKTKAEQATKSPFDISSPNTFMGSIVHGLASSMIRNYNINGKSLASTTGAVIGYTGEVINGLFGDVRAAGEGEDYLRTFGDYCETTPGTTSGSTDIYCTDKTTIYTGLMNKGSDYWKDKIDTDSYKNDFVLPAMDKWATTGIKDADVCEKVKGGAGLIGSILDFFGLYDACSGVDDDIATGAAFVIHDGNDTAKRYSAFTLYDTVKSLLSETQSTSSVILEKYYAAHPMDNSRAGILARRSGLTKAEAETALAYADYLVMVAEYDASTRYAFGGGAKVAGESKLVRHANKVSSEAYCFRREEMLFSDVRNRNFA